MAVADPLTVGQQQTAYFLVTYRDDDDQVVERHLSHRKTAEAVAHYRAPALVLAVSFHRDPVTGVRVETQELVKEFK